MRKGSALLGTVLALALSTAAQADTVPINLSGGDFFQNWSNPGLISIDNNWGNVPGIRGFRGDNLTLVSGAHPPTVEDPSGVVNVLANQNNPNLVATGGVAEFQGLADPTIALQGSGTADAPYLLIRINSLGRAGIRVEYNLRDIDGSTDNSIQPVALQFRIGNSGVFTEIPEAFVQDASTGPFLTVATPISVLLPDILDNQALVELRIMTTNAVGNDEWIGVDDIGIYSGRAAGVPEPSTLALLGIGVIGLLARRLRGA